MFLKSFSFLCLAETKIFGVGVKSINGGKQIKKLRPTFLNKNLYSRAEDGEIDDEYRIILGFCTLPTIEINNEIKLGNQTIIFNNIKKNVNKFKKFLLRFFLLNFGLQPEKTWRYWTGAR